MWEGTWVENPSIQIAIGPMDGLDWNDLKQYQHHTRTCLVGDMNEVIKVLYQLPILLGT